MKHPQDIFRSPFPNAGVIFRNVVVATFCILTHSSFSQLISESQWFFGNSPANMQFDKNGELVYEEERMSSPFGTGGPTVISSSLNGNLLLYSDGERIYDASGELMDGSTGIVGNPGINQAAVASPTPDISHRYILFSNPGTGGTNEIEFHIFDASAAGNGSTFEPLGQITSTRNPTGLTEPSEGMIVIRSNKPGFFNTYWLITQNSITYDFNVTPITNDGIGTTQTFGFDNTTDRPGIRASQFDYSYGQSLLAVAPQNANRNVWLLNFNDTTGMLSFDRQILNTGNSDDAGESIYDVEWSNNGSKLYMSRYGNSDSTVAMVYQFDLNDTLNTVSPLFQTSLYRSYGLKRAIDGKMYHLYQEQIDGPYLVGRFDFIDSVYNLVSYEPRYFDTDFNGTQFPAHAPGNFHGFTSVDFLFTDDCEFNETKFYPNVDPIPNNYFWDFGDFTISSGVAPVKTFDAAGGYFVTLFVELNGVIDAVSKPIDIIGQEEADLGQDTVICPGESITLDPGISGISYIWSTGETSQTIEVDTSGVFWVSVETASGCREYDEIEVTLYGVQSTTMNQWYFGDRAGIDFNQTPAQPIVDENLMYSPEGCATMSNSNGELLFYTNGSTVWNKDHQIMSAIDSLTGVVIEGAAINIGGDSTAAQGVMIMPFQGEEGNTMFYIFTANEVYGDFQYDMTYSIVDMKYDSAQGAVVQKNLPFFENSVEKVTVSSFDASPWLMTHEFGNNSFRANPITPGGIGPTTYTPLGEVIDSQEEEQASGYMKFGTTGFQTVFANVIPGPNYVEIFDFIDSTGRLENVIQIETNENRDLYGLEFSGGGTKLYVTTDQKLIQYDLDSLRADDPKQGIEDSKYDGYSTANDCGALQSGPDGIIYMARDGATSLGSINSPDGDDDLANFQQDGFDLAGRISFRGLPNFAQNQGSPTQPPSLAYEAACFGDSTQFLASGTSQIDEYFWNFDIASDTSSNPPTGNGQAISTYYNSLGAFTFTLNITNRCGYDSLFTDSLEVFSIPEQPMIPDNASICNGPLELVAWDENRPDLNYYWNTGDTTSSIIITDLTEIRGLIPPLTIQTAIINDDGCSSDTLSVFVGDTRPGVDLGPDRLFCERELVPDLNAQNNIDVSIQWTIDGLEADTTQFQSVNTQTPGAFLYAVSVTETITGNQCQNTDTVLVTVQEGPEATPSFTPPSNCGLADAIVNLEFPESGSYLWDFSGFNIGTSGQIEGPDFAPTIAALAAGTYNYSVTDIVTGCVLDYPVLIDDNTPFNLTARNLPDCNSDLKLRLTMSGLSTPDRVNVYITDILFDTIYEEFDVRVPITSSPPLDSGLYFVTSQDLVDGCFSSDSVLIAPYLPGVSDCEPAIHAPNAFSPNGNGQNEEFFVYPNPFVDQFEIFIYSRWGELVYYSDDQYFRWDGGFSGQVLGPGTFAYIIKYTSLEEPELGTQTQYGSVTIIR